MKAEKKRRAPGGGRGANENSEPTQVIPRAAGAVNPSREAFRVALVAVMTTFGRDLASLLDEHRGGSGEGPALERWPGNAKQLRRLRARLAALGFELQVLPVGRAFYVLRAELAQVPAVLARKEAPGLAQVPAAPIAANDSTADEDANLDAEAAALLDNVLARHGAEIATARRAGGRRG